MPEGQPSRLFLDTGVIIDGCVSMFSASRGLLILASQHRQLYTIVLAAEVEDELRIALESKVHGVTEALQRQGVADAAGQAEQIRQSAATWLTRVRLERPPRCSADDIRRVKADILPVLRHEHDLPPVVAAIAAKPDWIISNNSRHWSPELAKRINLRIVTAREFTALLAPHSDSP